MFKKTISYLLTLLIFPSIVTGQTILKEQFKTSIDNYINSNKLNILREFTELLSIPNVTDDRENIRKNAVHIKTMMEKRGISALLIETPGNPVVYGELKVPGAKKTLMFYVHYDGQPVSPPDWIDSGPFRPVLRPGKLEAGSTEPEPVPFPDKSDKLKDDYRIYARASSDDKAPVTGLLSALDALKSSGIKIKHNLKFIFEGEEEGGSTHLRQFLADNKNILSADILFLCDGPAYFNGKPTICFGVRGITSLELTVYGPNTSLHSGHYGNWAPNPGIKLAKLLASMKDKDGKVLIEGFYDSVIPLSKTEEKAVKAVPDYDEYLKENLGFSFTEGGGKRLIEMLQYPSLNIRGLHSGWTGNQARTIIPPDATASIDIRLVKGNDPKDMVNKVIEHIKKQGYYIVNADPDKKTRMRHPHIIKVRPGKGYRASRTSMDLPVSESVLKTLDCYRGKGETVILPALGGSLPLYHFEEVLGIPMMIVSIANFDNNQHQPNENLRLGNLWEGIKTYAAILLME